MKKFLNKKDLKIFLTFFLLFSYFINWPGMNENSRFFLTRTIVDDGRLEIDSFYNQTSDRSYYNGHYYSDKEPGLSFLAVPSYAVWKFIYHSFLPSQFIQQMQGSTEYRTQNAHGEQIVILTNPGAFTLSSMIIVTIFTSCLFSALTVVLIYKISKYYTKKEMHRILLVITYGLGSLAFHYSLIFLGYASGAFFIFLAFYLLLKSGRENLDESRYFLLAGALAGFSIVIELANILIAGLLFLYVILSKRRMWKKSVPMFLVGGFIGILPFLLYNFLVFGNPIDLPRNHMDLVIWKNLQDNIGIRFNPAYNLHVILRMLVFPYKGLFIYFPILVLSIPGIFFMYKKNKKEAVFILIVFLSVLFLASMWWAWWHGAVFGPRLLMPMIPFLMIPILFAFKKISLKVVLLLLIISTFTNLIGLQSNYEDLLKDLNSSEMLPKYQERFNNFQVLEDPLMGYYLPRFLEFGPRSRIFESLLYDSTKMIDIRGSISMRRENVPFLSLVPLIAGFLIIWRNDIKSLKKKILFV